MDGRRVIKYGLGGSADILGIQAPWGRFLAIECKTGSGRQRDDQKAFQDMIEAHGGVYILARSLDDLAVLRMEPTAPKSTSAQSS